MYRNQVLNHVVLAEINYFQKEKVNDLKLYMKSFLKQQIDFYQKVFRKNILDFFYVSKIILLFF